MQVDRLLNFAGAEGWRADRYRPWVQHLLSRFGPGRVAYGSGWPLSMPHATWKESLACFTQAMGARTMSDRELILGENALKFYRPPSSPVRYTE
jgi:L-fuconolactonase